MNILDWFRGRYPLRQLGRVIERLPSHSHYKAAVWDDDDAAEFLASLPTSKTFGLLDWTPERAQNAQIIEYLAAIHSRLVAQSSKNGKGPKVHPQPRPKTSVDRLDHIRLMAQHETLTAILLPNRDK